MGIEGLAIFPAFVCIVAMTVIFMSRIRNVHQALIAVFFSIILIICTSTTLLIIVHLFEFIGLSIIGEPFYLGVVALVMYLGIRYGRMNLGFTYRESVFQGIAVLFGCVTIALCYLGWTVKI